MRLHHTVLSELGTVTSSVITIQEMRKFWRPSPRLGRASGVLWIISGFLIYALMHLDGFSEKEEKPYYLLARPAEDHEEKIPLNLIPSEMPNLPLSYLRGPNNDDLYFPRKCGHYPSLWDIRFNNFYWQVLHGTQAIFYLYSAFYDNRKLTTHTPSLRILGMINKFDTSNFKVYCQIWFEGLKEPVVTKIRNYNYIWRYNYGNTADGILQPFLMRCHIPEHFYYLIPVSVSLTERPCAKASNNIRVTYNPPAGGKKNFAVCVKGIDFIYSDHSVRVVEWLELLALLGADKVYINILGAHPNYTKVLEYYEKKGFVETMKTSLPGDQPSAPSLIHLYHQVNFLNQYQNELIPLNDCFYRNIYRYKFVALIDIDEVLTPKGHDNWISLLNKLDSAALSEDGSKYASFYFRNIYFLDDMQKKNDYFEDIPEYMHILQHVHRSFNYTAPMDYVKGFHNTNLVLTLHNHLPFECLNWGGCLLYPINITDGHMQHYRSDCAPELTKVCYLYRANTVLDTTLLKYKKDLISNTTHALKQIGYFGSAQK
ncbi:hypothetical protein SK128_021715 [Halocaridina rubra]|uniref:Glycosyltransferase family 92 protein n=1 Tax=Halocaridina rubra TaxID=373956 RepID=A0AAN9A5Q6_HALRR